MLLDGLGNLIAAVLAEAGFGKREVCGPLTRQKFCVFLHAVGGIVPTEVDRDHFFSEIKLQE
jgi:hypothetical protein